MFWWVYEKQGIDASNSTICNWAHRRILEHLGLWRTPLWQSSWKAPMRPTPNICIRRLKMAIVAIVHLRVVDVGFVLRSSGRTSQIQLLLEQSQQIEDSIRMSRELATSPP
jgi:hypothetical protein